MRGYTGDPGPAKAVALIPQQSGNHGHVPEYFCARRLQVFSIPMRRIAKAAHPGTRSSGNADKHLHAVVHINVQPIPGQIFANARCATISLSTSTPSQSKITNSGRIATVHHLQPTQGHDGLSPRHPPRTNEIWVSPYLRMSTTSNPSGGTTGAFSSQTINASGTNQPPARATTSACSPSPLP